MLTLPVALALVLGLIGFWLVDQVIRMQLLLRHVPRKNRITQWRRVLILTVVAVAGSFVATGEHVMLGFPARLLIDVVVILLTWKHVTQDIDVVVGDPQWRERIALVVAAVASHFFPLFLLPWLFLVMHSFQGWTHHGTLPLRIAMVFVGMFLLVVIPSRLLPEYAIAEAPGVGEVFFLLALTIHASHYVIPAIGKMRLGPRPYSWANENRLHAVAASAYSWGWARFLQRETAIRIVRALKPFDVPLQWITLVLEMGIVFALFHPIALYVLATGLIGMHVMIFLSTGILFWEWMILNATFCVSVALLEPDVLSRLFSIESGIACAALVFLFPVRNLLWKPVWLAWWDTPFTARVHWEVIGESGKEYGLYNDYLCPHERLFGRVHGYAMVPERIVTYHLGQIYPVDQSEHHKKSAVPFESFCDRELRDLVLASNGDPHALTAIKERFGAVRRDLDEEREHLRYMKTFLRRVGRGERKHVLPRALRFLKAPGGQYYYWGDRPGYRGQEPVKTLRFRFREEYFTGDRFAVICDRVLREVRIAKPKRKKSARAPKANIAAT